MLRHLRLAAVLGTSLALSAAAAALAQPTPAAKPYQVEWVYRVQYGHQAEWWKIFQKYQIAILDREQQLGYVTRYTVTRPGLHTSEDSRWDYRIVITYPNYEGSTHEGEVERQLFPDRTNLDRDEQQRWEWTANHWDLPIHDIDPHVAE
jgi:opacity protein-like surface antigen